MKNFRLSFALMLMHSICSAQICSIKSSSSAPKLASRYDLMSSSGNYIIDNATLAELNFLASRFLVTPNFFFYNDNEGINAKASAEVTNYYRPDGTIIFGKRLFNNAFLTTNGSTAIPIIIAHEFAHIVDFKYGALQGISNKKKELFADYLAGAYMSIRIRFYGFVDINAAVSIFEDLGDTDFGNTDRHGSSEERVSALMAGYDNAEYYVRAGMANLLTLKQCIKDAKKYINELPDEEEPDVVDPN